MPCMPRPWDLPIPAPERRCFSKASCPTICNKCWKNGGLTRVTSRYERALSGKAHLIIYADPSPGNIIQLAFQQLPFQGLQVVYKQLAFNMIVFVQDNSCRNTVESGRMRKELLIEIFQSHFLITVDVFPDLGNAQATFIIRPFLAVELHDMRIVKYLFGTRLIRIFAFVLFILVGEYLAGIHYKEPDVPVDLRRSQPYPATVIHGLPHIFYQFGQPGVFGGNIFTHCAKDGGAISHYR